MSDGNVEYFFKNILQNKIEIATCNSCHTTLTTNHRFVNYDAEKFMFLFDNVDNVICPDDCYGLYTQYHLHAMIITNGQHCKTVIKLGIRDYVICDDDTFINIKGDLKDVLGNDYKIKVALYGKGYVTLKYDPSYTPKDIEEEVDCQQFDTSYNSLDLEKGMNEIEYYVNKQKHSKIELKNEKLKDRILLNSSIQSITKENFKISFGFREYSSNMDIVVEAQNKSDHSLNDLNISIIFQGYKINAFENSTIDANSTSKQFFRLDLKQDAVKYVEAQVQLNQSQVPYKNTLRFTL